MQCYYSDLKEGRVTPKFDGQQFYLVDRNEVWTYPRSFPAEWLTEPAPKRHSKLTIFVVVLFLIVFAVDVALAWELFQRLEWLK